MTLSQRLLAVLFMACSLHAAPDNYGNIATATVILTPPGQAGGLSPISLSPATQGSPYSASITMPDGASPYSFAVTAGSLPAGLTLAANGILSGTPSVAGTSNWTTTGTDANGNTATRSYSLTINPAATVVYRFRVGSSTPYTDSLGNVWAGDTNGYIYPGNYDTDTNTITNTADPTLYSTLRYDSPTLYVTLPVSAGTYTVKLKFAEPYYTSAGSRVFHIDIDGVRKLSNFDIYADAGAAHKADDKTFVVTAAGPYLTIALNAVTDNAMINAVEVTQ